MEKCYAHIYKLIAQMKYLNIDVFGLYPKFLIYGFFENNYFNKEFKPVDLL